MKKKDQNILVLTYWSFTDALIQTYTLPYVKIIADCLSENSNVFLMTLDKSAEKNECNHKKISNISFEYKNYGIEGFFMWLKLILKLFFLIRKKNISTIHAWCMPAGMLGYILSKITGVKLIIDSYEPHAEAMVENGTWKKNSFAFWLLFKFEKLQTKKAKYLIAASSGMRDYANKKYGHSKNNYFVKPACVDLDLFSEKNIKKKSLIEKYNLENKIVCVYAGKFGGIYLDNEVFDFFKVAETYWGNKFVAIILSSQTKEEIDRFANKSNLNKNTIIHLFVKHSDVPDYMGLADFAITPVKKVPTKKYCSPIKNGEYWALGLPVVITDEISEDSAIIKEEEIGSVLYELNEQAYWDSINRINELLSQKHEINLFSKIRNIAVKYRNFDIAQSIYEQLYKAS